MPALTVNTRDGQCRYVCNLEPMWRKHIAVELVKEAKIKASLGSCCFWWRIIAILERKSGKKERLFQSQKFKYRPLLHSPLLPLCCCCCCLSSGVPHRPAPYFTSPPCRLNGNHVCSVMTGWLGSARLPLESRS